MRVGVIGTGEMGRHHVRVYSQMGDVELVGISDINEARVKQLSKEYETKSYTDHRELLKEGLDAVSIAVPTTLHKEIAMDSIDAGANLLIEKPIAESMKSAHEIVGKANESGLQLMVGQIERFNPAVTKLKEIIDSGLLGKGVAMTARRVGPYNPRIRDVGIIIDLGVHDIDVISYLYGGKVTEVYAIAGSEIHTFEDHASILMRYGSERSGMVETNWLTPHKIRKLSAVGLEGVCYLDYIDQTVTIHDKEWVREAKVDKDEPLVRELRHFIRSIRDKTEPLANGEEGIHTLKVALAAIESYRQMRPVALEG